MSWTVHRTRKTKRRLATVTSAIPAETNMGPALAKEIIAALFQHAPHRGAGASTRRAASERPTTTVVLRPEYACSQCGSMNWCDRTACRHCKQPRPAGWSAGGGPAGRASGRRAKASTRPGANIASPGQQAEALRQAAAAAKRGRMLYSLWPKRSAPRECDRPQQRAPSRSTWLALPSIKLQPQ